MKKAIICFFTLVVFACSLVSSEIREPEEIQLYNTFKFGHCIMHI